MDAQNGTKQTPTTSKLQGRNSISVAVNGAYGNGKTVATTNLADERKERGKANLGGKNNRADEYM